MAHADDDGFVPGTGREFPARHVLVEENRILKRIATGAPPGEVLAEIARFVESLCSGAACAVLRSEPGQNGNANWLRCVAAPSLPSEYSTAVNVARMTEDSLCSGVAAFTQQTLFVDDLTRNSTGCQTLLRFASIAEMAGMRAISASPILSPADHQMLGVMVIYYHQRREPSPEELHFVEAGRYLAGISLENQRINRARDESESRYRALAENSPMAIWQLSLEYKTIYANAALLRLLEVPDIAAINGRDFHSFFSEQSLQTVAREHRRRTTGEPSTYRVELVSALGHRRQVMISGAPIMEGKQLTGLMGTLVDVTEREQMAYALLESERRFRYLIDHAGDALYIYERNINAKFIEVNQQACELVGYTRDEMLTMGVSDIADEPIELLQAKWDGLKPNVAVTVRRHQRHKDGRLIPVEIRLVLIDTDNAEYVLALARDITERIAAELALRRSEERYRTLVETADEGIWVIDPDAITTFVNEKMALMLGWEPQEMIGRSLQDFLFPGDWDEVKVELKRQSNGVRDRRDVRRKRRDGSELWASMSVSSIVSETGLYTGLLGMFTDIGERRRAEERLRASNATIEAIFAHSPLGIIAVDTHQVIQRANLAAKRILGLVPGMSIFSSATQVDRESPSQDELWQRLLAGEVLTGIETRRQRNDGEIVRIRIHAAHLRDETGVITGIVSIFADISESDTLKEQLLQSQKMEAVGRLAGGIAHDFGNMLAVISGYAESMLRHLPDTAPLREHAEEIERAAQRGAMLIRQLLAFNRRRPETVRPVHLSEVFNSVHRMITSSINDRINLTARMEFGLPPIKADHAQMEQLLVNLALNARDAMPRGGQLLIDARSEYLTNGQVPPLPAGRYVRLAVADTGIGMDPETCSRVFEPFYTTKAKTGTGLGLSIVHGIVNERGGTIRVQSALGLGTTFEVFFPAMEITP